MLSYVLETVIKSRSNTTSTVCVEVLSDCIKSVASGKVTVSEPRLVSEVGRVREVVCAYIIVLTAIGEVEVLDTSTGRMCIVYFQVTPGLY